MEVLQDLVPYVEEKMEPSDYNDLMYQHKANNQPKQFETQVTTSAETFVANRTAWQHSLPTGDVLFDRDQFEQQWFVRNNLVLDNMLPNFEDKPLNLIAIPNEYGFDTSYPMKYSNHELAPVSTSSHLFSEPGLGDSIHHQTGLPESAAAAVSSEHLFSCKICKKGFKNLVELNIHSREHSTGHFECEICTKVFSSASHLKAHRRSHNVTDRPYVCTICGKNFTHAANLNTHIRIHNGQKPYSCDICGKEFRLSSHLKEHCRVHVKELHFITCNYCRKKFSHSSHISVHMESSHPCEVEWDCTCDLCGISFGSVAEVDRHSQKHDWRTNITCDVCGKKFKKAWYLKSHARIHTGEKPFSCNQCGMSFTFLNSLKNHSKRHAVA